MTGSRLLQFTACFASLACFTAIGCEKKAPQSAAPSSGGDGHTHAPGEGHDHGHDEHGHEAGHGGAVVHLGEATIGQFVAVATRDEGEVIAGKDAPIDVTVTPVPGGTAKVAAVRFWIGTQDAAGSVKAKAAVENADEPNRWHTHAEVPNPIPVGSMLWVEIEDDAGATSAGSFALKM